MDSVPKLYERLGEIPKQNGETVQSLKELVKFLQLGARKDLKTISLETILSMSAVTDNGTWAILSVPEVLVSLVFLLQDNDACITKDAACCLINLSADKYGPRELLNLDEEYCPPLQTKPKSIVHECFKHIFDKKSIIADHCCMILCNLSRDKDAAIQTYELLEDSEFRINDILSIFTKVQYNEVGANLHYLGPWLSNMTQDKRVRKFIFDSINVVNNLLPYTTYKKSTVRRGGVVGVLRNLCLDVEFNEWLVFEVDILPSLLLPLAGNEEFDDEDTETLPSELQYLPDDKERESDPDIRKMLVEAITQLCTEKKNREYIRDKGTYLIMRELHKWEKDPAVLTAVGNLVDILIRTEEEIGLENLKDVEVPDDLAEKFSKMDNNDTV
ncbi:protein HGH1 homolog [Coccinella septempunctata]|uniref:protein HGH1 homolog n=1 Tax=Coccinella septempunctata TaxID=41139 RepID=UPI001D0976EE|nr:protein HGH1 homolog [Coccinella septempunctata]